MNEKFTFSREAGTRVPSTDDFSKLLLLKYKFSWITFIGLSYYVKSFADIQYLCLLMFCKNIFIRCFFRFAFWKSQKDTLKSDELLIDNQTNIKVPPANSIQCLWQKVIFLKGDVVDGSEMALMGISTFIASKSLALKSVFKSFYTSPLLLWLSDTFQDFHIMTGLIWSNKMKFSWLFFEELKPVTQATYLILLMSN